MTQPVKRRPYSSTVRREQAARTRQRIVEAAGELFEATGYGRTTIKAIAERAGVAPDTVYSAFGSKIRVLTALIDARLAPDPEVANVFDRPEAIAVRDETDQRRQLHLFAQDMARVVPRVRPVYEILRTAAAVEPEAAAVRREMDGYRLENMRRIAGWLAERGPLRMDVDDAAELIWVQASPDVATMLLLGREWDTEQYAEWLEQTLARLLLPED